MGESNADIGQRDAFVSFTAQPVYLAYKVAQKIECFKRQIADEANNAIA